MWRTILTSAVEGDQSIVFVAEREHSLVGFGACGGQRDDQLRERGFGGEIRAIYVLQSQQRNGVGRQLMRVMAQALTVHGRTAASLWVISGNVRAPAFYEQLGGELIGERIDDVEGTAVPEVAYGWKDLARLAR